jgi:hypothetical protein
VIDTHKFSAFHHYDFEEWKRVSSVNRTLLLVNDGELSGSRKDLLFEVAKIHCADLDLGWAALSGDKRITRFLKRENADAPYWVIVDPVRGCQFVETRPDPTLGELTAFIDAARGSSVACEPWEGGASAPVPADGKAVLLWVWLAPVALLIAAAVWLGVHIRSIPKIE